MFDAILEVVVWFFYLIVIGLIAKAAFAIFMIGWNFL